LEGNTDGDDSSSSIPDLPEAASNQDSGTLPLDGPRDSVERAHGRHGEEPDPGDAGDEVGSITARHEASPEEVKLESTEEVLTETLEMLVSSSGPIPSAVDLYEYTPDHQERIMRMAEAPRTDESQRRSALTNAQVSVVKRAQWLQAFLFAGCIAATAVSLWVFRQPLGVVFLGLPAVQGLNALVKSVRSKD